MTTQKASGIGFEELLCLAFETAGRRSSLGTDVSLRPEAHEGDASAPSALQKPHVRGGESPCRTRGAIMSDFQHEVQNTEALFPKRRAGAGINHLRNNPNLELLGSHEGRRVFLLTYIFMAHLLPKLTF